MSSGTAGILEFKKIIDPTPLPENAGSWFSTVYLLNLFHLFAGTTSLNDFSNLAVDMHSHLIPGIDDGAPDMATALELVKGLKKLGYHKVITTPHVMGEYYPNSSETIRKGLAALKSAVLEAGLAMEIEAAAEYHLDELFETRLKERDLLTLSDKRLLLELSFFSEPPQLEHHIFTLRTAGYRPVLAHVERYAYYTGQWTVMERFKEMGCALQVNILSLTGYYGKPAAKWATQLIRRKMVDFLGTDLHNRGHLDLLQQALKNETVRKALRTQQFQNNSL